MCSRCAFMQGVRIVVFKNDFFLRHLALFSTKRVAKNPSRIRCSFPGLGEAGLQVAGRPTQRVLAPSQARHLKPLGCQPITVSGLTRIRACCQSVHRRESATQNARDLALLLDALFVVRSMNQLWLKSSSSGRKRKTSPLYVRVSNRAVTAGTCASTSISSVSQTERHCSRERRVDETSENRVVRLARAPGSS